MHYQKKREAQRLSKGLEKGKTWKKELEPREKRMKEWRWKCRRNKSKWKGRQGAGSREGGDSVRRETFSFTGICHHHFTSEHSWSPSEELFCQPSKPATLHTPHARTTHYAQRPGSEANFSMLRLLQSDAEWERASTSDISAHCTFPLGSRWRRSFDTLHPADSWEGWSSPAGSMSSSNTTIR